VQRVSNKETKLQEQIKLVQTDDQKTHVYGKVAKYPEMQLFIFVEANCNLLLRKKITHGQASSVHL